MRYPLRLSLLVLLFALLNIMVRVLGTALPVFTQMFWRMLLGAIVLTSIFGFAQFRSLGRRDWMVAISRSFLLTVFGGGCWILALSMEKVGVVSFITCLPYEAFCGLLIFRERISKLQGIGLTLGVVGIALLNDFSLGFGLSLGVTLALISGLAWGVGVAMTRFHSPGLTTFTLAILTLWLGAFWSGAGALATGQSFALHGSAIVWVCFVGSTVAVTLTSWLLADIARNVSLTSLALANLAQPVITAVLAYFAFSEVLTPLETLGCVLIIAGASLPFLRPAKEAVQIKTELPS